MPGTPPPQEATPRKPALWQDVHLTWLLVVSLRGIASHLGNSRNTLRKYVALPVAPVNGTPRRAAYMATQDETGGHFP